MPTITEVTKEYEDWLVYKLNRLNHKSWYHKLGFVKKVEVTRDEVRKQSTLDYFISFGDFTYRNDKRLERIKVLIDQAIGNDTILYVSKSDINYLHGWVTNPTSRDVYYNSALY